MQPFTLVQPPPTDLPVWHLMHDVDSLQAKQSTMIYGHLLHLKILNMVSNTR